MQNAAVKGLSSSAPTAAEVEMAELPLRDVAQPRHGAAGELRHRGDHECDPAGPRIHRRDAIIKFEGCYHGHADSLLVKAARGC